VEKFVHIMSACDASFVKAQVTSFLKP